MKKAAPIDFTVFEGKKLTLLLLQNPTHKIFLKELWFLETLVPYKYMPVFFYFADTDQCQCHVCQGKMIVNRML